LRLPTGSGQGTGACLACAEFALSALTLDRVTKRFADFTAVDQLSFDVPEGSIFGFLGPNGAGKTTSLRMVLDLLRPDSGQILIGGQPPGRAALAEIGYLPEERGLYKRMSALDLVAYFGMLKGLRGQAAKAEATMLLDRVGLGVSTARRIDRLSKGLAQKVQLATALINRPKLLLLDEPFSGLDPVNQQSLETMIRDLAKRGATVVFSTHVMQHAERLCDRVVLLAGGRKAFDGTVAEARAAAPRRLVLEGALTKDEAAALPGVYGVEDSERAEDGALRITATLAPGAEAQAALRAAFSRNLDLRRFDLREPTLHDAFIVLTGGGA
jgi:ABC-2 type transport system ATP-binding protein